MLSHLCIISTLIEFLFLPNVVRARALHERMPTIACSAIPAPTIPGVQILHINAAEVQNASGTFIDLAGADSGPITNLNYCDVNITYTHPGVNDEILTEVWLPLAGWNGRFVGQGGGAYAAGLLGETMGVAVSQGFSTAATDGGLISLDGNTPLPKVFSSPGVIDLGLFDDFSTRALHELAVIGKSVSTVFYGSSPHHSYWTGCSTGGRQGSQLAQRYPTDFDGIVANAPAVYWQNLMNVLYWPTLVMSTTDTLVPQCVFSAFLEAAIAAWDHLDGLLDGVINNPHQCFFDPDTLVGDSVSCTGGNVIITPTMADVVRQIHDGPHGTSGLHLWDSYEWGAPLYAILANLTTVRGRTETSPWPLPATWITWFEIHDPSFNISNVTLSQYIDNWLTGWIQYGGMIGTSNTDLSAFRDRGGKMLTWHGLADQLIPPNSTLYYRRQIEDIMGGYNRTNEFYRNFFSGGANHCGGGNGPTPTNQLQAVIDWVENGTPPIKLEGAFVGVDGNAATRPICLWPQVARYNGRGNASLASSFACADIF